MILSYRLPARVLMGVCKRWEIAKMPPRNLAPILALRVMSLIPTSAPDRSTLNSSLVRRSLGQTSRRDVWWVWPVLVFLGLGTFIVYSTWAAFQGRYYHYGPYLSPFYSPELFGDSPHSWLDR